MARLDAEAIGRRFQDVGPAWVLLAWLLVAVGVAWNRGVGLLWGMVWLLVAAIAAAWAWPLLQLRGVRVARTVPAEGTVGEPADVVYEVDAGAWPAYGVEIHERLGDDDALVLAAVLPRVRGRTTVRLRWTPSVRGRRVFAAIALESGFPLGLAQRRRTIALPEQATLVHPDTVRLRRLPVEDGSQAALENASLRLRGGHDDYVGSRPWSPGDARRDVDWRAVARSGALVVREHDRVLDRTLWIVLDVARDSHSGAGRNGSFETMFRVAASVLRHARSGQLPVGLVWREGGVLRTLPPAVDGHAFAQLRDVLARVAADAGPPSAVWLARERARLPQGGTWLLFALAGGGTRRALADACRACGGAPVVVEYDRAAGDGAVASVRAADGALVARVGPGVDLAALF